MAKFFRISNSSHQRCIDRLTFTMQNPNINNSTYKKLEKKRLYHIAVYSKQSELCRVLYKNEKDYIWNKIKV